LAFENIIKREQKSNECFYLVEQHSGRIKSIVHVVLYVNAYNYVSQYASCDLHWEHDNKTIPQIIKMFRKYSVMTNYFYRFLLYNTLKGGCANELCKSGFYWVHYISCIHQCIIL